MIIITKIYLIIQLTILILTIIIRIISANLYYLKIIYYLPIIINNLFIIKNYSNNKLKLAIFLTLIADYFFLFSNQKSLGISFFITIQTTYFLYLNNLNINKIYLLNILIIIITAITDKIIITVSIIYLLISITNIYLVFNKSKFNKKLNYLKYSLILLALCDICILIKHFTNQNLLLDILERLFYNSSQAITIYYLLNSSYYKKYSLQNQINLPIYIN